MSLSSSSSSYRKGFRISAIEACDFSRLRPVSNEEVLAAAGHESSAESRMSRFLSDRMGIHNRYHAPKGPGGLDALDLARDALTRLLRSDPSLRERAEFLILAGISSPMPTVCTSALLAGELELLSASCWDLKSGCSTGVLALQQAMDWIERGARAGIIVCAETLSKFADPSQLQIAASTGDGAVALSIEASSEDTEEWRVLGVVHGTDGRYLKNIFVPGKYPIDQASYRPEDYVFHFEGKPEALERIAGYWQSSLADLLKASGVSGQEVDHYISHQVDGFKNAAFARSQGIPEDSIAKCFDRYGNMGCPTIFVNYLEWARSGRKALKAGDKLVFHAVGGGLSWAGVCLEKVR